MDYNFPVSFNNFTINSNGDVVVVSSQQLGNLRLTASSGITHDISVINLPLALNLSKSWSIDFESGRGAPDKIEIDSLKSWTMFSNKMINYFSGTGSYKKQFSLPQSYFNKEMKIILDLGVVKELGEVIINGKKMGVIWSPPYVIDITRYLIAGKNDLEIRVTNTWVNRLIGDKNVPKEQQICRIYSPDPKWYTATSPLPVSGLIGPVVISVSKMVKLKLN